MAFLSDIKREICEAPPKSACCRRALLLGVLAAKGYLKDGVLCVRLTDLFTVELVRHLIKEQLGREAQMLASAHGGRARVVCFQSGAAFRFLEALSDNLLKQPFKKCPACSRAFLCGVFLSSGYMTDPQKAYRLELSLGERAELFLDYLQNEHGICTRVAKRRQEVLLYVKDSTVIEEMMMLLGINDAAFHLMNSKIEKQFRNEVNRRTNCEAGNINRSVAAASRIVSVLRHLEEEKLLSSLPDELEDAARLRLAHPEASLSQLAAMMTPPITKSGLNHRLAKVLSYAETLANKHKK